MSASTGPWSLASGGGSIFFFTLFSLFTRGREGNALRRSAMEPPRVPWLTRLMNYCTRSGTPAETTRYVELEKDRRQLPCWEQVLCNRCGRSDLENAR
eukprot:3604459-Prymnesium_polylepis.1